MKKGIFSLLFIFIALSIVAQNQNEVNQKYKPEPPLTIKFIITKDEITEKVGPTLGVILDRPVLIAEIEGEIYNDALIELDAASYNSILDTGVKVVVKDSKGNKLFNKRFSNSYLYAFSDGTIQVGVGYALCQVCLYKKDGVWLLRVREKGLY